MPAQNLVYAAYVYDGDAGEALDRRMRVVRLTHDPAANTLGQPETVIEGLIAGDDHNAGRLKLGPDGSLFQSEQGPKTDDERNLLQAGGNYGWPFVAGFRDDQAYVYGAWAYAPDCASLTFSDYEIPNSVPRHVETDWAEDFVKPMKTLFTVRNGYSFHDGKCGDMAFICWPTISPASIDYYAADAVPGWKNSLLVASLKNGAVYRLGLNADGKSAQGDIEKLFDSQNRYRDLAISPDGKTIFVATHATGITRTTDGGTSNQMANPGAILAFTFGE